MNIYIVVEGKCGERIVYPQWIKFVNPAMEQVFKLSEIQENNFYLISGNGYPGYLRIIESAIIDCNTHSSIDLLVIAVDAEDRSYSEKKVEIENHIRDKIEQDRVRIIIQYPCLETWALGNLVVFRRHPQDNTLRKYLGIYDVRVNDPENLPPNKEYNLNRCQFAFVYLKKIINDRYRGLTYTKNNPKVIVHQKYFERIRSRWQNTDHIKSFESFLTAFGEK